MINTALPILLLLGAATAPPKPADTTVANLLALVGNSSASVRARAAAIDDLGKLGATQLGTNTPQVVTALTNLLGSNVVGQEVDFLRWRAIRALGLIGPPAQSALAAIATVDTIDPTVNTDRDTAVTRIAAAPKTPTTTNAPADPTPNPATIVGLGLDLQSKSPATQLAALKNLAAAKDAALPLLDPISKLMTSAGDADVRREAAETTHTLVDILLGTTATAAAKETAPKKAPAKAPVDKAPAKAGADKPAPKADADQAPAKDAATDKPTASKEEWLRIYVENLDSMLGNLKHDQQERLFAITALAAADKQYAKNYPNVANYAVGALQTAQSDKDPFVAKIAQTALTPATPADPAQKPAPDSAGGKTIPADSKPKQ